MPTFGGIVVATGSESTGRRTLLEIVEELSRPIDASDSTVRAKAADAFRAAVRIMNRKGNWPWEIQEEDIAITANQRTSTVASAIKKPLAMHLLAAAGGVQDERLSYEPYEVFIERFDTNITSNPRIYTIKNLFETGQVLWHPIPSANDNARFTFYRVTPAPTNESEAVEIPDYATESYMAFAWFEFLKRLSAAQRPFDLAIAMQSAKDAFREISAHVAQAGDRSRETW